jgi:hypothetical protein
LPFLRDGAKGIAEYREEAVRLGRQLGQQGVDDANEFAQAQSRLQRATMGVANALGDKLGVALTPVLNQFATWLGTSPQVTAALDATGVAAKKFANWLQSVNWTAVGDSVASIATHVDSVAKALGGWQAVGEDVLGFFALKWLAGMLLPFARIAALLITLPKAAAAAQIGVNGELAKIAGGSVASGLTSLVTTLTALGIAGYVSEKNRQDTFAKASNNDPSAIASGLTGEYIAPATGDMPDGGFGLIGAYLRRLILGGPGGRGAGGDSGGTVSIAPGEAVANARMMADVFGKGGLTKEGAAAMIGAGAMGESGLNPDPKHNNEGRGFFQDSPTRQKEIADHFRAVSFAALSNRQQAEGALWELQTKPEFASLNTQLRTSHDLDANSDGVVKTFEAPADIPGNQGARRPMSRGALRQIQLDDQNALPPGQPSGDPVNMPPVGAPGAPGATGTVDMNVKVQGAAQVTTQATGNVNVETRNVAKSGY